MRSEMKILLVCAGGMSTGLLMKKMEKYAAENGIALTINAVGVSVSTIQFEINKSGYEVLLLGPQVRFKLKEIQQKVSIPCAVMESRDYGMQNCKAILAAADKLYEQREAQ